LTTWRTLPFAAGSGFCGSRIFAGMLLTVTMIASPVGAFETQFVVTISPSGDAAFWTCFVNVL